MQVARDNVEFLRAWEDGTWDVESYDCPEDPSDPEFARKAMEWCNAVLATQTKYRHIVFWGVYAIHPDGFRGDN